MAKYLIFIPPHFGHINPTLGVGDALIKKGNDVLWVGVSDVNPDIFPTGGSFVFPPEFKEHQAEIQKIIDRQDECTNNTANKMIKWAFESTWLPFHYLMMKGVKQVIEREKPDLIIYDEALKAVPVMAHLMQIPHVTSISSVPGLHYAGSVLLPEDDIWLQDAMNNILEENGIAKNTEVFNSPYLNLIYSSRQFSGGGLFPEHYSFVGPVIEGRKDTVLLESLDIGSLPGPVIYVSTGSLLKDIKKKFYSKVIEAFANESVTVLLTADPATFEEWPSNFIPRAFWPQLELLPNVDAVVSPGGFNTINETLYFGKPMLIIPLANDQFGNGALMESSGCGLRLRYRRLTAIQLRESVFELLNNKAIKEAVQEESHRLRSAGGGQKAAELIEAVLENQTLKTTT